MNRRALIICTRPQDYAPAPLRLSARYLLDRPDTTGDDAAPSDRSERVATEQAGRKISANISGGFATEAGTG